MSDYMVDETTGPVAIRYRKIVMWIHWITAILVVMLKGVRHERPA